MAYAMAMQNLPENVYYLVDNIQFFEGNCRYIFNIPLYSFIIALSYTIDITVFY